MSPPRKSKLEEQRAERARRDETRHAPSPGPGEAPESDPGGDTLVSDATSPGPPSEAGEAADREVAGGSAITGHPSPASPPTSVEPVWSETHLTLPPRMTWEEWCESGSAIQRMHVSIGWWLGDWWLHGETQWGEEAAQALSDQVAPQTVHNCASVASRIPPDERVAGLTYSHHAAAAYLDAPSRRELLAEAASEQMTVKDVRARVRALKGSPNGEHPTHHVSEDGESDGSVAGETEPEGGGGGPPSPDGPLAVVREAWDAGRDFAPFSDELLAEAREALRAEQNDRRRLDAALESEFSRRAET